MKIALIIILCLIIFILVHVLISQLDDLCEYEKKINKAIDYIEEGDLLYLASKCSIIYRNNIEVVAICDRLKDLLDILKGEDKE